MSLRRPTGLLIWVQKGEPVGARLSWRERPKKSLPVPSRTRANRCEPFYPDSARETRGSQLPAEHALPGNKSGRALGVPRKRQRELRPAPCRLVDGSLPTSTLAATVRPAAAQTKSGFDVPHSTTCSLSTYA